MFKGDALLPALYRLFIYYLYQLPACQVCRVNVVGHLCTDYPSLFWSTGSHLIPPQLFHKCWTRTHFRKCISDVSWTRILVTEYEQATRWAKENCPPKEGSTGQGEASSVRNFSSISRWPKNPQRKPQQIAYQEYFRQSLLILLVVRLAVGLKCDLIIATK